MDHFVAMLTATSASDEQTARVTRAALALELPDGAAGQLARAVMPVVADAAHLL